MASCLSLITLVFIIFFHFAHANRVASGPLEILKSFKTTTTGKWESTFDLIPRMQQDLSNLAKQKQHSSLSSLLHPPTPLLLPLWSCSFGSLCHLRGDHSSLIMPVIWTHASLSSCPTHTHTPLVGGEQTWRIQTQTHQPANEIMQTQTWMIWQKLTYFMVFEYGNLKRGAIEKREGGGGYSVLPEMRVQSRQSLFFISRPGEPIEWGSW